MSQTKQQQDEYGSHVRQVPSLHRRQLAIHLKDVDEREAPLCLTQHMGVRGEHLTKSPLIIDPVSMSTPHA